MNTTDSRAPKSMLQQLSEQRVARIKQEKTAAPTLDNSVKGIGSSINVKGSGHIDWKSYQSRPRRSLMEIIEQDRLANRHLSAEAQEQLIRQRIEDFNNHGDDPLMWDRARQRREKEKLDAERKARGEVEVEEDLSASKPVKAEDAYSTEIPIGLIDGDAPLSLQQLHAITPFFHYYITQYDLRANPLPLLQRFLRFWSLHEPCAPDQVPSDGKRLPMVSNIYDSYHLAQVCFTCFSSVLARTAVWFSHLMLFGIPGHGRQLSSAGRREFDARRIGRGELSARYALGRC
jgi:hypothetical protein